MPRTPTNLDAGNFMLDLALLAPKAVPDVLAGWLSNTTLQDVLHRSRRPAILPYSSPILSLSHKALHLPWHLMNLRDLDRSRLVVPMFEMLSYGRGQRNVPTHARLELQSESVLQVYDARLVFRAQFQGLRYLVYTYRVTFYLLFTTLFYLVSVGTMLLGWAVISHIRSSGSDDGRAVKYTGAKGSTSVKTEGEPFSATTKIKTEDDTESSGPGGLSMANVSDTPVQYPTGRNQPPLSYAGRSGSGDAANAASAEEERLRTPLGADEAADDEDEADVPQEEEEIRGRPFDSGIGTSMESEHTSRGLVRRRSGRDANK
jgi:seipin